MLPTDFSKKTQPTISKRIKETALSSAKFVRGLSLGKKLIIFAVFLFILAGEIYNHQTSTPATDYNIKSEVASNLSTTQENPTSSTDIKIEPGTSAEKTTEEKRKEEEAKNKVLAAQTKLASTVAPSPSTLPSPSPTSTISPTQAPTSSPSPSPTASPTPTITEDKAKVEISIKFPSDIVNFDLEVEEGQKVCSVMRKAKDAGKIQSLDIRHDSAMNTDGIWVINGIGNPNSMSWTYKINGSSPPWGCSHPNSPSISDGDEISWEYLNI